MKTVLLTSFHPFVSRNILSAPFFELLKKSGLRIVIVVPEKKIGFFEREYSNENVIICGVPGRIRRIDAFFIEPGKPKAIAGAVKRLINEPALYAGLSERGAKFVRAALSWKKYATDMLAIFEKSCAMKRSKL